MSETEVAFEHQANFDRGEVAGQLRTGKFEAQYEALFAEVIEDGIITAEERAQLDRTADELGLDKDRLKRLEAALQAAYEARHQVKIADLSALKALPLDEPPPSSIRPLEPSHDPRVQALERRIKYLEARVEELEKELEEARAHVAVEVDFSDVAAPKPAAQTVDDDPVELLRRIRHDPTDAESIHGLFRFYSKQNDIDRAWCAAHAAYALGAATPEEKVIYGRHKTDGLIKPTAAVSQEAWRRLLFHPEEEIVTGEMFAVIASAVLLGRVSALRRDKLLPSLEQAKKQDPATSTLQSVRCFSWAASALGMISPTLYADPTYEGVVEMVPGIPPVSRLGKKALSGRDAPELAFFAGRHLAWYREEHFVRLLVPAIPDLEDLFLTALMIGNPGIPLGAEVRKRVAPLAKAIEPILEPVYVDRLRGYFLRFVEEGGRTNLQRWASAADKTASRAGLLLCNDLIAAKNMLELEDPEQAKERFDDLIVFITSDRYNAIRKQIGIAVKA